MLTGSYQENPESGKPKEFGSPEFGRQPLPRETEVGSFLLQPHPSPLTHLFVEGILKGQCRQLVQPPPLLLSKAGLKPGGVGGSSMGSVPRRKGAQCCRNIYTTDLRPQRAVSIEGRAG